MERIKCFFLEPTDRARVYLRRYSDGPCAASGRFTYHNVSIFLEERAAVYSDGKHLDVQHHPLDDPRWPAACGCGYEFKEEEKQVRQEQVYRRTDTGEEMTLGDAPVGAIWNAWWYPDQYKGPDGRSLICRVPGPHDWMIDGRASNCTMPNDWDHRCWVRHGEPPNLTVDKNGRTCAAGAGSIAVPKWHGFLRNGYLEG